VRWVRTSWFNIIRIVCKVGGQGKYLYMCIFAS